MSELLLGGIYKANAQTIEEVLPFPEMAEDGCCPICHHEIPDDEETSIAVEVRLEDGRKTGLWIHEGCDLRTGN